MKRRYFFFSFFFGPYNETQQGSKTDTFLCRVTIYNLWMWCLNQSPHCGGFPSFAERTLTLTYCRLLNELLKTSSLPWEKLKCVYVPQMYSFTSVWPRPTEACIINKKREIKADWSYFFLLDVNVCAAYQHVCVFLLSLCVCTCVFMWVWKISQ